MAVGRYLIIGGGFSEAVDHATLAISEWGRHRLGSKEGLHAHEERDPWIRHVSHKMGQWPALIVLPGYHERHESVAQDEFLLEGRLTGESVETRP